MKYIITKRFTSGLLKGLDYVEETNVNFKLGKEIKNPVAGSPYIIIKIRRK
uniref:Uncharacterized protein n=1 Tax=viral metagenome TaxID=1070528 RepID=A0A6M3JQ55_9ZZZZ